MAIVAAEVKAQWIACGFVAWCVSVMKAVRRLWDSICNWRCQNERFENGDLLPVIISKLPSSLGAQTLQKVINHGKGHKKPAIFRVIG
jgi:hypothetical protein